MKKAVFLDRDGTINEDVGYLYDQDRLRFIPRSLEALRLIDEYFTLFIVTNQPGIGQGVYTAEQYREFNGHFQSVLKDNGIDIQETYCCPHRKEEKCGCYKPGTYFMEKARKDHGVDPEKAYVVGDHPHDVEMGLRMGAKGVYLLTGHGRRHRPELTVKPDIICDDLYEAALWILCREGIGPPAGPARG